jgi:hypothetical protein
VSHRLLTLQPTATIGMSRDSLIRFTTDIRHSPSETRETRRDRQRQRGREK